MKKNRLLLLLLLSVAGSHISGQSVYMKVEGGAKNIKGESTLSGHTDQTELLGLNMEVASPRDPSSGLPTGRRAYQPVTILKKSGPSSPVFFDALATNALLPKVIIEVYRADAVYKGIETKGTVITLENVSVSSFRIVNGRSSDYSNSKPEVTYDEIKFVFQKITIEDVPARTMGKDDWQTAH